MNEFDETQLEESEKSKTGETTTILVKVYNRAQARRCDALGIAYDRVKQTPVTNTTKREFKQYRKDLAFKHGSITGVLKKKHIRREKLLQEKEEFLLNNSGVINE